MEGVLLVNKPKGMTSRDVVNKLNKLLKTKRIGHTGTLDPDVSGLLVVCVGKATKLVQFLTTEDKIYDGTIGIGFSTTTEDASGEVVSSKPVEALDENLVDSTMGSFLGKQIQIPPMYSAVKVNGKRLYEYARNNEEVDRPKREVAIETFERTSSIFYEENVAYFDFHAVVSKGTYIRTLCVDLGEKLGYPAHMKQLVRTKQGPFLLKDAATLEEIESGAFRMLTNREALTSYQQVEVDDDLYFKIRNGQKLPVGDHKEFPLVFTYKNEAIAIYEQVNDMMKPVRVL